jgi:CheY-like chemotaxis protein
VGISPDRHESIFEVFEQAERASERWRGGAGLGLAICRQLAELMDGSIEVESTLGVGSRFRLTLTFAKVTPAREAARPAGLEDLRVLIADPEASWRRVFGDYLSSWGCRVNEAGDARQALQVLDASAAHDPISVVLVDENLPPGGAELVAREVRGRQGWRPPPLIVLCRAGMPGSGSFNSGAFAAALSKPVRRARLLRTLSASLARPERRVPSQFARTRGILPPLRILVAEDHEANRKVALHMLERLGCRPDIVTDGWAAVEAVAGTPYDLVLMDVQMPGMNGLEATEAIRLRERSTSAHTMIVAMTAHAMESDRTRCLEAGMDGYLLKPLRVLELYQALMRWGAKLDPGSGHLFGAILVRHEGDLAFARELMETFAKEAPGMMAAIAEALAVGDAEKASFAAHGFKGDCQAVCADPLAEAALEVERAARRGDLDCAALAFERLRGAWADVGSELARTWV